MKKADKKQLARKLIMDQLAIIGYGERYEEFVRAIDDGTKHKEDVLAEADEILMEQMNRIAKLMGYNNAWFY